tara:strand:- start:289 stop:1344 length:1056 start_codon:yes stop_codon:yes gene_type:complete
MKTVLVTGGTGFIGSHTCYVLLRENFNLIILDSFINSHSLSIKRVCKLLCIKDINNRINLIEGDIRDTKLLEDIFKKANESNKSIGAVIHFAGLKSVRESILDPINYWDVNVLGSLNLLKVMQKFRCCTLIYSSSATIYGIPKDLPLKETSSIEPFNTYGSTKAAVEKIIFDIKLSNYSKDWKIASLRYFNPIGAHPSGEIGENPLNEPNNLIPYITQVSIGKREKLIIYGNDYATSDGTGVRDYIHVMDLAEAHLAALNYLQSNSQIISFNIGTGKGTSVLELLKTFEEINNLSVPYVFAGRREGDVPIYYADNEKALKHLDWEPKFTLEDMCRDSWNWQRLNPNGFNQK